MIDKRTAKIILVVTTVAYISCAALIGLLAPKSLISLDRPGQAMATLIYAVTVMSFPVVLVVSVAAGWVLYRMRQYRNSLLVLMMPLTNILIVAALFASHQ